MDERFKDLFKLADYASEERYDLAKFMPYKEDTFDVLNSPFLLGLKNLPLWRYYRCESGSKDIDLISYDAYGTLFYGYLIQYYNDTTKEIFDETDVLKLFSIEDLEDLYNKVSNGDITSII
jgi:hypothetical protein